MANRLSLGVSIFAFLLVAAPVYGQGAGGIVVRVPDDPNAASRCINPTTDEIWLTLRRVITTRTKGWFSKDADVSIVINANPKTDPAPTTPIIYPLAAQAQFGDAPTGQVSVPIEYTIVSGLVLTQTEGGKKVTYTGMGVDVTLLNTRQANGLATAIQALVTVTNSGKIPIPPSPYTTAANYLLGFANNAITKSISDTDPKNKAVTGSLALNFDTTGSNCSNKTPAGGDFETTGTKAFLSSDGIKDPPAGTAIYVDINQVNNFCWTAELSPGFVLKATPKSGATPCTDPSYGPQFLPVSNNYTAFFMNKATVPKVLGPPSAALRRDRKESLLRCQANGIASDNCPGAK